VGGGVGGWGRGNGLVGTNTRSGLYNAMGPGLKAERCMVRTDAHIMAARAVMWAKASATQATT
jgi:hypothetical protein